MSNIKKLRWINLFGASIFAVYGVLIEAWPVLCLNGFIVLTDIYHLYKMSRKSEFFSLLPLADRPSPYLRRFVEFHGEEIHRIFPQFKLRDEGLEGWWVLRNMQPVGLFLYHRSDDEHSIVDIDYVTPAFRDMKTARWFFDEGLEHLRNRGIKALSTHAPTPVHQAYLRKVGFELSEDAHYIMQIEAAGELTV